MVPYVVGAVGAVTVMHVLLFVLHVACVCVWLWAGWEVLVGEWVRELGLGFTNSGGTWGKWKKKKK